MGPQYISIYIYLLRLFLEKRKSILTFSPPLIDVIRIQPCALLWHCMKPIQGEHHFQFFCIARGWFLCGSLWNHPSIFKSGRNDIERKFNTFAGWTGCSNGTMISLNNSERNENLPGIMTSGNPSLRAMQVCFVTQSGCSSLSCN